MTNSSEQDRQDLHADEAVAADSTVAKPKRRGRRWLLLGLGGVVCLGLLVALAPTLLSTGVGRGIVLTQVNGAIDQEIELEGLDLGWGSGAALTGLRVIDPAHPGEPMLEATSVTLDVPLYSMLGGAISGKGLVVDGAVIRVFEKAAKDDEANDEKSGSGAGDDDGKTASTLPEVDLPLSIRDAVVIYVPLTGDPIRHDGVQIAAHAHTRGKPTTFDVSVGSTGGTAGSPLLSAKGEALIADAAGLQLDEKTLTANAKVTVNGLDAERYAALIAKALPDQPVRGRLYADATVQHAGGTTTADFTLRVEDSAVGDAVRLRPRGKAVDADVKGQLTATAKQVTVSGLSVAAAGITASADISAEGMAVQGKGRLGGDLAQLGARLAEIGFPLPVTLEGTLDGRFDVPAEGDGTVSLEAQGLAVTPEGEDAKTVRMDPVRFTAKLRNDADAVSILQANLDVPGLGVSAKGQAGKNGSLDVTADLSGDLTKLLAALRDIAVVPERVDLAGKLGGTLKVTQAAGGSPSVTFERLGLTDDRMTLLASGSRDAAGALDIQITGEGDVARLVRFDTAEKPFAATFALAASVSGTPNSLHAKLAKLSVDGDLQASASGELKPDGAVSGDVRLAGVVDDLLRVVAKFGATDRELTLGGNISASARVAGTKDKPVVPELALTLTDGPVTASFTGSLSEAGELAAKGGIDARVADLLSLAHTNGYMESPLAADSPLQRGAFALKLTVAGSRDAVAIPEATLKLDGGAIALDASASVAGDGALAGKVHAGAPIVDLIDLAVAQGVLKERPGIGGSFAFDATIGGTRDAPEVPALKLVADGQLGMTASGAVKADRSFAIDSTLDMDARALAALVRARDGKPGADATGRLTGAVSIGGTAEAFTVDAKDVALATGSTRVTVSATRAADESVSAKSAVAGRIEDLIALARAFGVEQELTIRGAVSFDGQTAMKDGRLTQTGRLGITDLDVLEPQVGGAPFREKSVTLDLTELLWDLDAGTLGNVVAKLAMDGVDADVTVAPTERPADAKPEDPTPLLAKGKLVLGSAFAQNHPELVADGKIESANAPFELRGDLMGGGDALAGWVGTIDVSATGIEMPNVVLSTVTSPIRLVGGVVYMDDVKAVVNDGPVEGKIRYQIHGDGRSHSLVAKGQNIVVDARLAPLLARVSPLFAASEIGGVETKVGFNIDLAGRGKEVAQMKRTLTGRGTLRMEEGLLNSESWLTKLLEMADRGQKVSLPATDIPFRIANGKVITDNVPVRSSGFALKLGGEVSLDGDIDYRMLFKPAKGNEKFERYATLLDPEGYLPLRLNGGFTNPSLALPSLKDVLTSGGGLGGLLDKFRKKKDDKDKPKQPKRKPADDDPPPKEQDPPPPPPPGGGEDPPPPPPPK